MAKKRRTKKQVRAVAALLRATMSSDYDELVSAYHRAFAVGAEIDPAQPGNTLDATVDALARMQGKALAEAQTDAPTVQTSDRAPQTLADYLPPNPTMADWHMFCVAGRDHDAIFLQQRMPDPEADRKVLEWAKANGIDRPIQTVRYDLL